MLCGYEGFMEFLSKKLLNHVFSIQSDHGCFGAPNFQSPGDQKNKITRKREANEIKNQCLDHTTGLGAAVLSLFLNFFVEKN